MVHQISYGCISNHTHERNHTGVGTAAKSSHRNKVSRYCFIVSCQVGLRDLQCYVTLIVWLVCDEKHSAMFYFM